jgi:hypothetical protein
MTFRRGLMSGWVLGVASAVGGIEPAAIKPPEAGVSFNGQTAYALPVEALKLNPKALTVSAWVKLTETQGAQEFLHVGRTNTGFSLYLFNGQVRMLIGHEAFAYAFADTNPPRPNTWVHYAGSYDGKTIRLYTNGGLASSLAVNGRVEGAVGKLYIGALDERDRFVRGEMEDLRVWRRTLTKAEIWAVAAGRSDASLEQDLAARWTRANLAGDTWKTEPATLPAAERVAAPLLINGKDTGYRGIWYMNQPSGDEYVYKYSGGMATYCANHIPHAWYAPQVKKTFFVYGGTTGDSFTHLMHMVSYYDHQTGQVPRPTILLDKKTSDAHDNPVLNIDEKGYIWIFAASHGRGRPSYICRSKQPYSVEEFELIWTGNFSYPQPWYFPGQGFLFMHTYYNPGRTICMMTSPDGVTWSDRQLLSSIQEGHYQVSRQVGEKIGTSFMYHPDGKGVNWRTNLYYMESGDLGKTWKTAAGQELKIPLKDVINPALIRDYEHEGLLVYIQDLAYTAEGHPVILYTTSKGYESGPKNDPRTWTTAHWTGTKWDIHGGDIVSDNNYDLGSLYIEAGDRWRIIGPTRNGPQAYNPGGEVAMWTSSDQGRSWEMVRQMTAGSAYNHSFVRRPVNAHPDFYGFWADGHGRKPSESRLYFCNQQGDVFRLPVQMTGELEKPQKIAAPD